MASRLIPLRATEKIAGNHNTRKPHGEKVLSRSRNSSPGASRSFLSRPLLLSALFFVSAAFILSTSASASSNTDPTAPAVAASDIDSTANAASSNTDSSTTGNEQANGTHGHSNRIITARRIKDGRIKIDGILDESVWQTADEATNFIQLEPDEGMPATEKTVVRLLYDDHAIYVGVRAFDSEPAKIAKMLSRRDSYCPSDWIRIAFDSYHDKRTAFEFSVNPSGVKRDCIWFNDTENDDNWNAVWDVKTRIDSNGWTAEFKIPFSQLRFANGGGSHVWGFQVGRTISRRNERSFWNPMHKNQNQVVSTFGEIEGLSDLPRATHLEFLPYSVGSVDTYGDPDDDPFKSESNYASRFGANVKYGLTSNITLDVTINPDFGQVEQDPSEVNLTAYESYFDEKRPFFMEGANIFQYPIMMGDDNNEGLFYSRRIGRPPQFYPLDTSRWPDAENYYENTPKFTKILGAAKVTGRTSKGWSIGVLEALTDKEEAQVELPTGERAGIAVEPMTNYFVARTIKDFNNGRSTIGGILTSVLRDIPNEDLDWMNRSAFSGGLDFTHRWHNDEFQISGKVMGSHIEGSTEAMLEAQTSSARYYQRPDAKHLGVDSSLTYMNGFAMTLFGGKFAGGNWHYGFGYITRSPGFEVNDIGYMRNADVHIAALFGGYNQFKPGKISREWHFNANVWDAWNYGSENVNLGGNINLGLQFLNYWGIYCGVSREASHQDNSILRGGPALMVPGTIQNWYGFHSDRRKKVSFSYHGSYSVNDEGFGSIGLGPSITIRPSGIFELSFAPSYRTSENDIQYVDDIDGHYLDDVSSGDLDFHREGTIRRGVEQPAVQP